MVASGTATWWLVGLSVTVLLPVVYASSGIRSHKSSDCLRTCMHVCAYQLAVFQCVPLVSV